MYFLSIIFLVIGAMLFFVLAKGYAVSKTGVTACAVYFSIMGLGMLVSTILDVEMAFLLFFCIGLGGAFIATAVFAMVKPFFCTCETQGEFKGVSRTGKYYYVARFTYQVNGKKYYGQSSNIYYERTLRRKFKEGCTYPLWYSEKNPAIFVERKRVKLMYLWILVLGLMFCYLPFYMMWGN